MSEQKSLSATFISALTPLVIGALGLYFTHIYKESELRANQINQERLELERRQRLLIDKADVSKGYFDYLGEKSDEKQKRAALAVLTTLGYIDLVINVVASDPSPDNIEALAAIAAMTNDSDAANKIIGALETIKRTAATEQARAAAESVLALTQAAETASGTDTVVVAGADKSLDQAQVEVDRLKKAGFDEAQVVKRGDWYRTVVPVQQAADSDETLKKIQSTVRPSAYVVDQLKWCKGETASTSCEPAKP